MRNSMHTLPVLFGSVVQNFRVAVPYCIIIMIIVGIYSVLILVDPTGLACDTSKGTPGLFDSGPY